METISSIARENLEMMLAGHNFRQKQGSNQEKNAHLTHITMVDEKTGFSDLGFTEQPLRKGIAVGSTGGYAYFLSLKPKFNLLDPNLLRI